MPDLPSPQPVTIQRHLSILRGSAASLAVLLLGACVNMSPDHRIPSVVEEMPAAFANTEASGTYRPAAWWHSFDDPVLNELVDAALSDNLDIAEAAARIERGRAQARIAGAALLPSVNLGADASYSDSPLAGSIFGGIGGGASRLVNETYSSSLGASYELDLFGRARADMQAARADFEAAKFDYQTVQLSAAAETIAAYFELVDTRRQIALAVQIEDVLAERVARDEERFASGLISSFELYQITQELRNVQASLPQLESALANVKGRLALFTRQYPERLGEQLEKPLTPRLDFAAIPVGLPIELLQQRPDVAAAYQRLESSRQSIGARRADRFPRLSLSASTGTQAAVPSGITNFADNWLLSLASAITAPIFDGGRISANIAAARATYDERAAAYAKTVLGAYNEALTAIEDYEEQRQRYRLIASQLEEARASLDLQARRYRAGIGTYTAYLDALRATHQVESSMSSSARATALSRLNIHRALGGDWFADDIAPQEGNLSLSQDDMDPAPQ